ncbi:MAG: MerR family transcriptional regulator [Coprothermobacterota bacterium]|nr:MerR family transcriptional regulator [Coprothermobacterota bacterium]
MLRIGEFSRLGNVSVKALRYYDQLGLLKPAQIHGRTGYRFYALDQLPRLHRILALKDLGFPLEQIATLLAEGLPATQLRGMLRMRRAEVVRQVEETKALLDRVEARLALIEQEGRSPAYEVLLKKAANCRIAYLADILPSYHEAGLLVDRLFDSLSSLFRKNCIPIAGSRMALYYEETTEGIPVEVAFPLKQALPSLGPARVRNLPGREIACVVVAGQWNRIAEAYAAILRWIDLNGYRVDGPTREIYLEFCQDDSSRHVIEIQFPVAKRWKGREGTVESKIVTLDAFQVVGMLYQGKNEHEEISRMWQNFMPRMEEIKHFTNALGEVSFGICYTPQEPIEPGDFHYIAALPVSELTDIPEGMVGKEIPAQTYAMVEAHGIGEIGQAYDFIIKQWLPTSGYQAVNAPDFELYPESFRDNGKDPLYIYFPIQKRE